MKLRPYQIPITLLLIIVLVGFSGHVAQADGLFGIPSIWDFLSEGTAFFANTALAIASWFVALTGMLLNVSINITMHMKDFVNSTPAIYDVWKAIRDISGMFIIFVLLYAAIRMILGQEAKLGDTIKNIIIAGILINFSFFVTALLIDASNVISLQLYKAITPGQPDIGEVIRANTEKDGSGTLSGTGPGIMSAVVGKLLNDGGLSAIFMQSLQVQSVFDPKNVNLGKNTAATGVSTPFKIILIGVTGVVIMITVGLSFLFAALAFVVRLVILLLLLAFSPVWFVAGIIPQLKEYADEWKKVLIGQLTFMPAYLLLMYAALLIITKSNLFKMGAYGGLWQGTQTTGVPTEFVTFAINAVFIIIMLNVPLLAAIKLGGSMGGLMDTKKWGDKISAGALWKKVGGTAGGLAGRNFIGRPMAALDEKIGNTKYGNKLWARDLRSGTTGAMAKGKYGGSRSFEETQKEQKNVANKQKQIDRANNLRNILALGTATPDQYKDIIGAMNEKEKLALDPKVLKNPEVLKHLKKSDFEAIKKSEDEDISKVDKKDIETARMAALGDAINNNQEKVITHMIKNMETDDLLKFMDDKYKTATNIPDALIENLTRGNLEALGKEKLDSNIKKLIGMPISTWDITHGKVHPAFGFIKKNDIEWTGLRIP